MNIQWLWLEDEKETVEDFNAAVEQGVSVRTFQRIPALTRYLLEIRQQVESGEVSVGFILDIMIQGAHAVARPRSWFGSANEAVFFANHGFEAGLVFYEKLVLGNGGSSPPLINPPPPVLFLTVMHKDSADLQVRFNEIREKWARAHKTELDKAKVSFVRKWEIGGPALIEILRTWEDKS